MKEFLAKLNKSKPIEILRKILQSNFFPFITAGVILLCYYLGWDIVAMYYVALSVTISLLILDDVTPVIGIVLFLNCFVSAINSPSALTGGSQYYFSPAILAQIIVLLIPSAGMVIYRTVSGIIKGNFVFTPMFLGYVVLSLAFILNGAFSAVYTVNNLLYGLMMVFFHTVFFVFICANVKLCKETYIKIAYAFLALAIMLVIEMGVLYLTTSDIIVEGAFVKEKIVFGWGIWNTMGMLLVCSLPFIIYLAGNCKFGYVYTLFSLVVLLCIFLTASRQAMVGALIVYPISFIVLIITGKNRLINLAIGVVAIITVLFVIAMYRDKFILILNSLLESLTNIQGQFTGNGRVPLIEKAFNKFLQSPIFGGGFYVELAEDPNFDGMGLIPDMYHNSIMQMLGACGAVGFIAYMVHRAQTAIVYFRRPTTERSYVALCIFALVIMGLFDNHLFYVFPTMFYSSLVAILTLGERGEGKPHNLLKNVKFK